jgi:MYXO-CTERM domain-containing protein
VNNFQGRYAILHKWEGAIECESPNRGRWGGPPGQPMPVWGAPNPLLRGDEAGQAQNTPEPPEDLPPVTSIGMLVTQDISEIGVVAGQAESPHPNDPGPPGGGGGGGGGSTTTGGGPSETPPAASSEGGCASCSVSGSEGGVAAMIGLGVIGLVLAGRRRRR